MKDLDKFPDMMVVLKDGKHVYERSWIQHITSPSVITIDKTNVNDFHVQSIRVPVQVFGTYLQFSKAFGDSLAMREVLANTVSLSFSIWSHFHYLETQQISAKMTSLYNGSRSDYNLYHRLILDKKELYGHEDTKEKKKVLDLEDIKRVEKPRLNIPLHETRLYPAVIENTTACGISASSFLTGIVAGGFLMYPNINDNARQDMLEVFRPLEERFRERYKLLTT